MTKNKFVEVIEGEDGGITNFEVYLWSDSRDWGERLGWFFDEKEATDFALSEAARLGCRVGEA